MQIMLVGESLAMTAVKLTTVSAVGISAVMGGANACGGSGESAPPAPVATGGEVLNGEATRCELTLAQDGPNFIGRAVVNGTIPGGSKLVYRALYRGATLKDNLHSTPQTKIPAEGTMRAGAAIYDVKNTNWKFLGLNGKIDLKGQSADLACSPATLTA